MPGPLGDLGWRRLVRHVLANAKRHGGVLRVPCSGLWAKLLNVGFLIFYHKVHTHTGEHKPHQSIVCSRSKCRGCGLSRTPGRNTSMHVHVPASVYVYVQAQVHVYEYVLFCMCLCVCVWVGGCVWVGVGVCVCVCMYVYIYIYMCVCMCIYIYKYISVRA